MTGQTKIALSVLAAVIVLAAGAYYWFDHSSGSTPPVSQSATASDAGNQVVPPTLPTGTDSSDEALAQDVASVDTDLGAMAGDTSSIDSGINDTPISQN